MARNKRRSSRADPSSWIGIGLISCAAVVAVLFLYAYVRTPRNPRLDPVNLCPLEGSRGVTVVLIDTSDDLPSITKREIIKLLMDEVEGLPSYELLDIRVLDAAHQTSRSVFARCNPGDGSGLSEWSSNPRMARKRWINSFQEPVEGIINKSIAPDISSSSPIMAAIQNIAVDRFTGKVAEADTRRLIIVSDMIENSPDYSHYKGDLSFQRFKISSSYKKYSTDLHGASVSIHYVQRLMKHPLDTIAHVRFWREWIDDNKGHLQDITRLQGAG